MFAANRLAPASLLLAATLWGIVWYPYRVLEAAGLSGSLATLLTYIVALVGVVLIFGPRIFRAETDRTWLLGVALAAGWTNIAYVLAVIHGEIMRVMLLFYLAPLWTLWLSRLVLGERPNTFGYLVIALSLGGAWVMLRGDGGGWPLPANGAEWFALSAGFAFALTNVLSRRLRHVAGGTRSAWIFCGAIAIASVSVLLDSASLPSLTALDSVHWGWVGLTGLALVVATLSVQHGVAHTPANRAIVILLSELVVAAIASWWLAGEAMEGREWLGGAMIVAASLFSGRMERVQTKTTGPSHA